MSGDAGAVLRARGLAVQRGDRRLLDGLDFEVAAGGLLQVAGANGTGKTSLLETLAGLRPPAAGTLEGVAPEQRHWVAHASGLHPALTPRENLEFHCALHEGEDARIGEALAHLGLQRCAHRPVRVLSAGQRRRTALARLLLVRRRLWLLDEPLASLDADGIPLFASLLREHLAGGGGAVLSTHQALPPDLLPQRVLELRPAGRTA